MARVILLLTALAASISLAAQQPASPNQTQAPQNVISVAPPPTVVVVGGGFYGPSVFMTPTANFATPQPAPGATQSGFVPGTAGISLNTPVYLGVTSTLGPAPLVYESGQPGYSYMPNAVSPAAVAGGETAATAGRPINDLGPSSYLGTAAPAAPAVSLGEVAASYRAGPPRAVRSYSNVDEELMALTIIATTAKVAPQNVLPQGAPVEPLAPQLQPPKPPRR